MSRVDRLVYAALLLAATLLVFLNSASVASNQKQPITTVPEPHHDLVVEQKPHQPSPPPPPAKEVPLKPSPKFQSPSNSLASRSTAADNHGKHSLLFPTSSSCPKPKTALIGVITVTDPNNSMRRQYLRPTYSQSNSSSEIDFVFVFGGPKNNQDNNIQKESLYLEQLLYPNDTVILPNPENMNDGKTFDWFAEARNRAYTPHPTEKDAWCPRYKYIGKTDDDTLVHVDRLNAFLKSLQEKDPNYIGTMYTGPPNWLHYMTGSLYILSTSLVEYITMTDREWVFENRIGHEDLTTGRWVNHTGVYVNWVSDRAKFHDQVDSPFYYSAFTTGETVSVHWNKDIHHFYTAVRELYFESEGVTAREAVRHYAKTKGWVLTESDWEGVLKQVDTFLVANGGPGIAQNELRAIEQLLQEKSIN
ncbi:hypothetical protein BDR26DRAFT_1003540 [Obelidium mucronatum]|nr:hypothetical protein BDR26DRAFT_1003540 [Obelidium mucronatum]